MTYEGALWTLEFTLMVKNGILYHGAGIQGWTWKRSAVDAEDVTLLPHGRAESRT